MTPAAYLLDTSVVVHLLEGGPERLLARVQAHDRGALVISAIVHAEVMVGAHRVGAVAATERLLASFPVLDFDLAAARAYARLAFKRGSFDRLIAAHALALGLPVVTANTRDFSNLDGLQVEDWTR